jgi:ADP-ribosylglycohydrolase
MVRHLCDTRKISPEVFAAAYVEWVDATDILCARLGRDRGFAGPNTLVAINQLRAGRSPYETGFGGTTGGAAMRVAPLGFLFPGNIAATVDAVEASCIPTHNTATAIGGASAVACAVSVMAAGATEIAEIIEAAMSGAELGIKRGSKLNYAASIARRIRMACDIALADRSWEQIRRDLYDLVGTGMASHEVVPSAIALFARAGGDVKRAVLSAANTGGDCDTLGAISGALSGAFQGAAAIPVEFETKIESVNGLGLASLAAQYDHAIRDTWMTPSREPLH